MSATRAPVARLFEIALSITDGDHQAPPKASHGIPFLTIAAINNGYLAIDRATRYVPETYFAAIGPDRKPRIGDVLFTVTGSIAIPAIVDDPRPFTFQRHIAIIRPDEKLVDTRYLWRALQTSEIKEQAHSVATGTAQLTIPLSGLRNFLVPLPPLPEQRRIVTKIDSVTSKSKRARDHLDHIPRLVEKYKQAVLAAAFRGDLTRAWRAKRGAGAGWTTTSPAEHFLWSSGKNLPAKKQAAGTVPVIGGNGIGGYHNEALISFPTLVIGRVGAQCGNVHFSSGPAWITDNAIYARSISDQVDLAFAIIFFRNADLNQLAGGSGQPFVNQSTLNALVLDLPPLDEQREIVRCVERMMAWIDRLATEATSARKLIDRLDQAVLAKAFRGELVPQDPADEPASLLLERIKGERSGAPKAKVGRNVR
ncbi:type I restriction enzyme S subunit [Mesorhizobium jarvisii]